MRHLVAGGGGFIGRHLCTALLQAGHEVICLDNFSTSEESALGDLRTRPGFELVVGAVEDIGTHRADVIFHLASPASPRHYQRLPLETLSANSTGSREVAQLALLTGARVVYASTSEVYGDPLEHPQREDYWGNVNPVGVRACYDEAKRFGEALFMEHHRQHGLDVRIARIFNTYGPGMALNDGRAVPEFVVAGLRGEPMLLHNGGIQTRSLCYVGDTVAGLVRLAEVPGIAGHVFNIGNPEEHTVREIAIAITAAIGVQPNLEEAPAAPDDPARRRPNVEKAYRVLSWQPRVELADGLRATVADFRSRLEVADA